MIVRREPNGVPVPVPPRERLDCFLRMLRVKLRAQDGAVTDSRVERASERLHGRSGPSHAEGGVPTGFHPTPGIKHVLAQYDVLTRDILLVCATSVVTTNHAAIGRRPLRPVDVVAVERKLFCRM